MLNMKILSSLVLASLVGVKAIPLLDSDTLSDTQTQSVRRYTNYCLSKNTINSYHKEQMFNWQCLCTENKRFEFCIWGNELLLWDDQLRKRLWSANNPTNQDVYLALTFGGTLTLRNRWTDKLVWASDDGYVDPFVSNRHVVSGAILYLRERGTVDIRKNSKVVWNAPNNRSTNERIICVGKTLRYDRKIGKTQYICSSEKTNNQGLSDDGFAFGLNSKGQVVLHYASNKKFYIINEKECNDPTLIMQGDGNLVLYNAGQVLFKTNTSGNFGAYLSIENDGVVTVKSMERCALWSARPTDGCKAGSLKPNEKLQRGEYLCYGNYRFGVDRDGLLSRWNWGTGERLASVSPRKGGYAMMQNNGSLVLKQAGNHKILWTSRTGGDSGSVLFMMGPNESDLKIINYKGVTIWTM